MIGHTRRHRRRHPQGLVNPTEIVVGEVQRQRRLEVRQFLAERIGRSGEPAAHHADGQVLPFDVARVDPGRIGIARNRQGAGGIIGLAALARQAATKGKAN